MTPELRDTIIGTDVELAARLLPAWFLPRMMTDEWSFAFVMVNGDIVHLTHIDALHRDVDGCIWLDVILSQIPVWQTAEKKIIAGRHITAPTERTQASINVRHVMLAFETAYP